MSAIRNSRARFRRTLLHSLMKQVDGTVGRGLKKKKKKKKRLEAEMCLFRSFVSSTFGEKESSEALSTVTSEFEHVARRRRRFEISSQLTGGSYKANRAALSPRLEVVRSTMQPGHKGSPLVEFSPRHSRRGESRLTLTNLRAEQSFRL